MKKMMTLAALLACAVCLAQTSADDYAARYQRQVRNAGAAGVGVETILDRWEADFPDDPAMFEGRSQYYLAKSLSTAVVPKDCQRFLGSDPVLVFKDTLGRDVRYFEENMFVDSLFALSQKAIDRAVALAPSELAYRVGKITGLMLYEKESPDLATRELLGLIDYHNTTHPAWTYYGVAVDDDTFVSTIQEYCYNLFKYATPGSFEAFKTVSETMLKAYPSNLGFMNNLGSYWLVYKGNYRQALKWYNKVLKKDPRDYNAAKNCVILARKQKSAKLEKKYLPYLIDATDSETERASSKARLEALQKK